MLREFDARNRAAFIELCASPQVGTCIDGRGPHDAEGEGEAAPVAYRQVVHP